MHAQKVQSGLDATATRERESSVCVWRKRCKDDYNAASYNRRLPVGTSSHSSFKQRCCHAASVSCDGQLNRQCICLHDGLLLELAQAVATAIP